MTAVLPFGLAALGGVCLCAGCNHLQMAVASRQRYMHGLFVAMCFAIAVGAFVCIAATQSSQPADSVTRVRWILSLVCLINVLFPWFMAAYVGVRARAICLAISALFAVLFCANVLLPYGIWFSAAPTLQSRVLPWGESVTGYAPLANNNWRIAFWILQTTLFVYFFALCVWQFRRGQRRRSIALFGSIGILLLACTNDWLIGIGLSRLPSTGLFGFLAMILLMSWDLHYTQRQADGQMQAVLDHVPAVVYVKDLLGRYIFVNRHFEKLFDVKSHQVNGKTDSELFTPATAQLLGHHDTQVLAARAPQSFEEIIDKDGAPHTYLSLKFPLGCDTTDGNSPYAVASVATDISERKRVDDAIRALAEASAALDGNEFFQYCVRNLADVYDAHYAFIGLFNADHTHIRTIAVCTNGEITNNFTYAVANTPCAELSAQPRWLVAEKLTQSYPNEQLIQMNVESYFGTQIVSSSGQITGVVAVLGQQPLRIGSSSESMLDVFANRISVELDRKVALNRLKELNDSLERRVAERTQELSEINEELEAFSYSVSHDLRAPLTVIDGFSKLLLEKHADSLEDSGVNYLQQISGSTRRMNSLIDALLSLARISRQPLRLRDVDLTAIANESIGKLQAAQPERQVAITIAAQVTAYADQELLTVVLDNLLSNAWKFTAKTNNARIEFGSIESASESVYYVRDNGAGFDSQHADKLFQPFHRQHHERDFPGTGVGLATVARIVRHHGGRIWAEAAVGLGAGIYFTLPLVNTQQVESDNDPADADASATERPRLVMAAK